MIGKRLTAIFSALSISCMTASLSIFAISNSAKMNGSEMENSYIRLSVEQDKNQSEYLRYKIKSAEGQLNNSEDNDKNLSYKYFFSGITSLRINGNDYIYGHGEDVSEPKFNTEEKSHTSAQRFGNVVIEQKLTFSEGFTKGFDDMVKISYKVLETGEGASVGTYIVIDPMIGDDDKTKFTVKNAEIANEAFFTGNIPAEWKAEMSNNSAVAAYGKTDGVLNAPDAIYFGNWNKMYTDLWNSTTDINSPIDDGAVAVKWEPEQVQKGQEFTTYYGIKNYAAADGGNKAKVVNTGVKFPVTSVIFMAAALAAGTASVIIRRKERDDEE